LDKNLALFTVILLLVTPLGALRTVAAWKAYCGAASMVSISILGSCVVFRSATGRVQGNILLDFDKDDLLLLVGRMCVAFTITFAFPMIVIPARDIILRLILLPRLEPAASPVKEEVAVLEAVDETLEEGDP
jgi:hypothetical protein